jgi:MFS family permease
LYFNQAIAKDPGYAWNQCGLSCRSASKSLAMTASGHHGLVGAIGFSKCFLFPPAVLPFTNGGGMLGGLVRTVPQLYGVRFLLGLAEAGFFPGILLYLTYWFRQRQLAQTVALFLTANPIANIFGSPLSGMILDHAHWFGVSSWRWLLILEGVPAVLGGVLTYLLLPS